MRHSNRFEFHIQIRSEISSVIAHLALLRGRPRCHVERNVAWGQVNSPYVIDEQGEFTQFLLRQGVRSRQTYMNYQVWADWEIGPILFLTLLNMTGKNALWIVTNHLTHSNSRSKWFYEPYKKMNVVRRPGYVCPEVPFVDSDRLWDWNAWVQNRGSYHLLCYLGLVT